MENNTYDLVYDLKKRLVTDAKFKQGDKDGSAFIMNLKDMGQAIDITGETIEFRFFKADKTTVYQDITTGVTILDGPNGIAECVLMSDTLSYPGVVKCEIHRAEDGKELTTPYFTFVVESSIGATGTLSVNYISSIETKIIDWQTEFDIITAEYNLALQENTDIEIVNARGGEVNLDTRLDKVDVSLATKATYDDTRLKATKLELEDMSDTTISAISGGATVNVLSTPQDDSTTYKKLATEIKDSIDVIENVISNGNFSNGVVGWISGFSASTTLNNVLTNTGNGGLATVSIKQALAVTNTKTYAKCKVRVTNANCTKIDFFITGGTGGLGTLSREYYFIDNPVINQWYDISGIVSATTGTEIYIRHNYIDATTANTKVMEVKEVLLVDLTLALGVGNEFTKEEMNTFLLKFPNSWFNSVANLYSAKEINKNVKKSITDIENVKTDTVFAISNVIKNGNFASGTTDWLFEYSTNTVLNNVLTNKSNGGLIIASLAQTISLTNTKTYAKAKIRVINADCTKIDFLLIGGTGGLGDGREYGSILNPVINQWYDLSGIVNATTGAKLYIRHYYASNAIANTKCMEVKEVHFIDLSTTFGVGEEPLISEMNTIFAKLPTWFVTSNLFNAEESFKKTHALETLVTVPSILVNELAMMGSRVDDSIIRAFTPFVTNWTGKTIATFGDSITWYDGRPYSTTQEEEGQIVKGYQTYMRESLSCTVLNEGHSGEDMTLIYTNQILPFDFSTVDAVTLTAGTNDQRVGILAGTVLAQGSAFDIGTYAGAMQKAIEKILTDKPTIKIMLITPIRGWFDSGTYTYKHELTTSRDYVNIINEIGLLYNLKVCDWYDGTGFNDLNYTTYLGDKIEGAYHLHPRNIGFKRMASILLPFLVNNQPSS